ncbi:Hsp20/alpha crystallin family protein [Leuconostoc pseudomesenteroides]|jgi:HSP20 family protein|uniref:Hsp20/alpha crystallin family protein n=1 Tax=Leuconostoc falkenbergense TaxID=2766470 RepID=A0ABT7S231_9LACO|nr:Hsp20/alpha crystallin family protein [Leuconostoc falkenbergense]MDM7647632.1 Hsp20/alpha crystallin family protein [Leuconostoc falkenbergense]MDN5584874.1 Hsp20/alpha crystallin family protein [Lactobacillus sp.]RDG17252.1 Hsp20/alpha crystallin family protein [Leuconostoc pseudomesenteroides]
MSNNLMQRFSSDDIFDFMNQAMHPWADQRLLPKSIKTDVIEKDDRFTVTAELAGVNKDDINIDYKNDQLLISAKRDELKDHTDHDGNILQSERTYGSVSRAYYLPGVDSNKITAKFANGELRVELPKQATEQSSTNIKID